MVEVIVVSLTAVLVALESPATIGRGMVLDAGSGLTDAQHHPCSFRRVPGQPLLAVQVFGDVEDFGGVDDRPARHLDRIWTESRITGEVGFLGPMGKARRAAQPHVRDARRMPGEHAVELGLDGGEACRFGKLHGLVSAGAAHPLAATALRPRTRPPRPIPKRIRRGSSPKPGSAPAAATAVARARRWR